MKKRSAKKETNFRRLFNKMGMTYVELICALALLSLVVVMFTPMLLSSYETLYIAGEKVEEVYDSKEEIEGGLAARSSINIANIGMTFKLNGEKLFENMNIAGRRITSHFQSELETVFHGARARVDLLTPDVVYDDTSWHDVVLQTTGLDWESKDVILRNLPQHRKMTYKEIEKKLIEGEAKIIIDIVKPNKQAGDSSTSTDSLVYDNGDRVNIIEKKGKLLDVDPVKKRISFRFNGADFTMSPLKICVYYVNERGVMKTLSDYLYIKPAHIIFAGQGGADYFTSAGIQQVDASGADSETQSKKYVLDIEGRGMTTDNSKLLSTGPLGSGVTINTIQWVANDENKGFDPYYVMAGTNGSVYRMYNMNTETSLKDLLGTKNDIDPTSDKRYNIDTGETIFQSFWSGEISDQYYFRTENVAAGYGTEVDNKTDCSRETSYNTFDTRFKYIMAFSGMRTGYNYRMQASRRMSYVLTEKNAYSFRFAGKKGSPTDYTGYTAVWEPSTECYVGPGYTHTPGLFSSWKWDVDHSAFSQRITAHEEAGVPYEKVIYFSNRGGLTAWSENEHHETNFAFISAISYTSVPVHALAFDNSENSLFNRFYGVNNSGSKGGYFWGYKGKDEEYKGNSGTIEKSLLDPYSSNVNIQSAVYLPGSSSTGKGQVIYLGTVPAYSLVRQSSDIGKPDRYMYNGKNMRESRCTLFYIMSDSSNGAYIAKYASYDQNHIGPTSDTFKWQLWNIFHQDTMNNSNVVSAQGGSNKGMVASLGSTYDLFTKGNENQSYYAHDPDLQFTFGYCSRWRMALGSVTSNGTTEATKSYESFYTDSHSGEKYERVPSSLNGGNEDNMYYNVWFPGEHYTLTKTATLDEVTVAVGYSVSGSSFMEDSGAEGIDGFYGTALGSVYNDGVLAAYTSADEYKYELAAEKGGQTNIFDNLLYYKSPDFTNDWTHSRANVRFTTVGLSAETSEQNSSNKGTKQYYAYYGDNRGNVYRSLVATADVTFQSVAGKDENDIITEKVNLVGAIPDTATDNASVTNGMELIKIGEDSINTVFSEITSIECYDDIVVITGVTQSNVKNCIVVGVRNTNNKIVFKRVYLPDAANVRINTSKIIGQYLYLGGNNLFAGVNLDVLRDIAANGTLNAAGGTDGFATDDRLFINWPSGGSIYAIGGYAAN